MPWGIGSTPPHPGLPHSYVEVEVIFTKKGVYQMEKADSSNRTNGEPQGTPQGSSGQACPGANQARPAHGEYSTGAPQSANVPTEGAPAAPSAWYHQGKWREIKPGDLDEAAELRKWMVRRGELSGPTYVPRRLGDDGAAFAVQAANMRAVLHEVVDELGHQDLQALYTVGRLLLLSAGDPRSMAVLNAFEIRCELFELSYAQGDADGRVHRLLQRVQSAALVGEATAIAAAGWQGQG